jgi:serine protease Do
MAMTNKFRSILIVLLVMAMTITFSACIDFNSLLTDIDDTTDLTDPGGQSDVDVGQRDSVVNFLTGIPPATEGNSLADTVEQTYRSVVEITASASGGTMAGSGVIVSIPDQDVKNIYIMTCQHVLDGANLNSIRVRLADGTDLRAYYVGGVRDKDIAVIKIEKTNAILSKIATATVRNLSEAPLRLAEETFVIGNPLGTLGGSVTRGIISAVAREINVEGNMMTLMQTDASINSGNSGGGIFDNSGLLIGIVNAKTMGEGIEGLGFAIPIDTASELAMTLIETANASDNPYGGLGYIPGKFMLGILSQTQSDYTVLISEVYNYGSLSSYVKANQYIVGMKTPSQTANNFTQTVTLQTMLKTVSIGDSVTFYIKQTKNASTTNVTITIKQYVYGYNHK